MIRGGSRRRLWAAALAVALAAIALAAVAVSGGGGSGTSAGDIVWHEAPRLITPETLPEERIVTGTVRNDSLRRVDIAAKEFRVVDAGGRPVQSAAILLSGFGRGLYNPVRKPRPLPDAEARRTGLVARLEPGQRVPLTVSWRQSGSFDQPLRIEHRSGSLPIPP